MEFFVNLKKTVKLKDVLLRNTKVQKILKL